MRRLGAAVVAAVAVVTTAGAALAAWTVGSLGADGRGAARTLPAGPTPTAIATGSTVTVSFPQVALDGTALGALTAGGYTVKRYDAGGVARIAGGSCHGPVRGSAPTLTCVEPDVPSGTWSYRISPDLAGWRGTEGEPGPPVTITGNSAEPAVTILSFTVAKGLGNTKVTAVGTASPLAGRVMVSVCRTTACTAAAAVNADDPGASVRVVAGVWTYTSPNLGAGSYYVVAEQTDAAGHTASSGISGPVVR